jgi:ABC-type multidrug transport system fused ATPase/permease subunit
MRVKNVFLKYLFSSHWRIFVLIGIFSVLIAALEGLGLSVFFPLFQGETVGFKTGMPVFLERYIEFFLRFSLQDRMMLIAAVLVVAVGLKLILTQRNALVTLGLKNAVVQHYRMACVKKILSSGSAFFNTRRLSDLNLMADTYTEVHVGAIVDLVGSSLPYLFTLIVLLAVLLSLSWKMTVVAFVVVAGGAGLLSFMARVIRQRSEVMFNAKSRYNKVLFDLLNGFKTIRVFCRENHVASVFGARSDEYNRTYLSSSLWTVMVGPSFELIGAIILAVILVCGAWLMAKGTVTLGVILTFLIILVRMIPPFKSLNHARASIVARLPVLKDIETFLNEPVNDVPDGTSEFAGLKFGIDFRGVEFSYGTGAPVLRGLSLVIPKGARVGIVGASGTGKTTLFELLLRFYDPKAGSLLVDGQDLRTFKRESWRRKVGVVAQEPFLFNDTVRANIAFADLSADEAMIKESARRAYAHDFIMALPQGYDTVVGERGCLLSGGQRQRIAIARALLLDPDILLFDEATSALDAESEALVQKAILENSAGKTVVTIAHRLSTLTGSDKIVVMEAGRIVQEGRHEELVKVEGAYQRFVTTQTI